jgi:hypothetical protein
MGVPLSWHCSDAAAPLRGHGKVVLPYPPGRPAAYTLSSLPSLTNLVSFQGVTCSITGDCRAAMLLKASASC